MKIKYKKIIFLMAFLFFLFAYKINTDEKTVCVSNKLPQTLIPSGQAMAMKLKTNGVMVVGCEKGLPGEKAGMKVGDILTYANDIKILNTKHFSDIIYKSGGEELTFRLLRNEKELSIKMRAQKNDSQQYVVGLWLRDSAAGIGTVSFYDAQKEKFYALGHPVNDIDTNKTYDVRCGEIVLVDIIGSKKAEKNKAGELMGSIEDYKIGNILKNTGTGIMGEISEKGIILEKEMEILPKNQVSLGKAYIMSTVSDKGVGKYEIEIVKILGGSENKDFIIKVTDEKLISQTGGIVRGM